MSKNNKKRVGKTIKLYEALFFGIAALLLSFIFLKIIFK